MHHVIYYRENRFYPKIFFPLTRLLVFSDTALILLLLKRLQLYLSYSGLILLLCLPYTILRLLNSYISLLFTVRSDVNLKKIKLMIQA